MFDNITRLEIIDETGRAYTTMNCRVEANIQDEGRTLKLFVTNLNKPIVLETSKGE